MMCLKNASHLSMHIMLKTISVQIVLECFPHITGTIVSRRAIGSKYTFWRYRFQILYS